MAGIPENTGIPNVEPSTEGIQVGNVSPEAFGAGIARGAKEFSAGLDKAVNFYGQVAADNATNNWHQKVESILYGDPNDPSTPGYYNLKGADAMRERPNVVRALQSAADEQRATLFTPESKFQFDQDTRRSRFLIDQQIGSHYEQQSQLWGVKTSNDKLNAAESMVAKNPNDAPTIALALRQAREATMKAHQLTEGSGFDAQQAITEADQRIRLKQLDAMRVTNPQAALDLLTKDEGGEVLRSLPNYASLVKSVQEDAVNASTAKTSDAQIALWKGRAAAAIHNPQAPADVGPTISKVDPRYQGVVGNILAGETARDPHSAGPDGTYHVAGLGQFTVEQWKATTGETIPKENVGVVGKDPRLDPDKSVQAISQFAEQNRDAYMKAFHREPSAGDLALMHQQGTTGGLKLLHALVDNPNAPASNFVAANALTGNRIDQHATVAQAVRGIEDYYGKASGGTFGGGGASGQYMSQSDFLMDHLDEAVDNYRSTVAADPAFAGRTDLIDRASQTFENNYRRAIRDQNQQYLADAHQIQSAVWQNKIVNENQLQALSPDIAATWFRLGYENPQAAEGIRNWFKANAGGQTKTYGTQFNNMLERVLAPVGDPNRINDPAQINGMITQGENSILTNTGASVLHQVMDERNKPGGEQDNAQLRAFLAQAKGVVDPLTNANAGQTSPEGQKRYEAFVGQTLQLVAAERAEGKPMAEILKKGGLVDSLIKGPSASELMAERRKVFTDPRMQPALRAAQYVRSSIDPKYLQDGITKGIISPHQASQAIKMGARSVTELQNAYKQKLITWDDASVALDHLNKYHRNFWGQAAQ